MAGQSKSARSIAYSESVSPTLKGSPSGLNQVPCVCEPQTASKRTVYNICSYSSNSMKSSNAKSGIYAAETSRTLDTNGGNPSCQQGGLLIVEPQIARTLTARGDSSPCVDRGQNIVAIGKTSANSLTPWDNQSSRIFSGDGNAPTLAGADGGGGRSPGGLIVTETHPDVTGALCASGAGLSRPAGNANETDLCVAYSLADNIQAESSGQYSLNNRNPARTNYIVRRLTPSECELLMSLPIDWTKYGHDGRILSDSARYQLCGNSIVVNCLAYIMQNIAELLRGREVGDDG